MVKQFAYRGDATEEWSNTYHFRDAPPADSTAWGTLVAALAAIEVPILNPFTSIVRAYGYDTDDEKPISVYTKDWELDGGAPVGTYAYSSGTEAPMAGDQATFVWWQLDVKNSRGKWIYLRKYIHGGFSVVGGPDSVSTAYKAALADYADELDFAGGAFHGGLRRRVDDADVLNHGVSPYTTTRTLHRRGKRPLAHP
jgi:hypothetical protein